MSPTPVQQRKVQQRESELISEFAAAPTGLASGARLTLDKSPSSLNAMQHGLTGHTLCISIAELPFYAELALGFMREIRPVGLREIGMAQFLFEARWRLHRILAVENDLFWFTAGDEAGHAELRPQGLARQVNAFRQDAHRIELISRYETRIVRNSARVNEELERLQKRRGRKQRFDEDSCPAVAWYRRLLQRANALVAAKQEHEDDLEKNIYQIANPKPLTRTASVGSESIPFCKKDSPNEAMIHDPDLASPNPLPSTVCVRLLGEEKANVH